MLTDGLGVFEDVGAGGTQVAGTASLILVCTKELEFSADGEGLAESHCVCGLTVVHDSAVFVRPAGAAGALGADESVFKAEDVVFEFGFVKEVTEFVLKAVFVAVVGYGDCAVLDPKSVGEVFAERVTSYFGGPAGEVFAVENGLESGLDGRNESGGENGGDHFCSRRNHTRLHDGEGFDCERRLGRARSPRGCGFA